MGGLILFHRPSAYLAKKLARPLPTTDGGTLRTVLDTRAYWCRS
jgi:hypothetical protein